jgi:hypothetical protein
MVEFEGSASVRVEAVPAAPRLAIPAPATPTPPSAATTAAAAAARQLLAPTPGGPSVTVTVGADDTFDDVAAKVQELGERRAAPSDMCLCVRAAMRPARAAPGCLPDSPRIGRLVTAPAS